MKKLTLKQMQNVMGGEETTTTTSTAKPEPKKVVKFKAGSALADPA